MTYEYQPGNIITVEVASGKSATAGSLAEMTDDYTARDNETSGSTQIIGVFLTSESAGNKVAVATRGVFSLTASAGGITAGKTVISAATNATTCEDGTTAGAIIGRALMTSASGSAADILIGQP